MRKEMHSTCLFGLKDTHIAFRWVTLNVYKKTPQGIFNNPKPCKSFNILRHISLLTFYSLNVCFVCLFFFPDLKAFGKLSHPDSKNMISFRV